MSRILQLVPIKYITFKSSYKLFTAGIFRLKKVKGHEKVPFFNLSLKSNYFGESTKPLGPLCLWQFLPLRVCPSSLYSFWNYLPLFPLQCYSLCLRQVLLMPTDWPSESWDSAPLWIVFYFVLLYNLLYVQLWLLSTLNCGQELGKGCLALIRCHQLAKTFQY